MREKEKNYTRAELNIGGNRSHEVVNKNLTFVVQIVVSICRGGQEGGTAVNVKHGGGSVMVHGCISVSGVGDFVKNLWNFGHIKVESNFNAKWKASGKHLIDNGCVTGFPNTRPVQ